MSESKSSERKATAKERQREALRYRIGGATFEAIGAKIGVTRQAAHQLVIKALAELQKEVIQDAETLRNMETQKLDTMQAAIWGDVLKGDLAAIDRALKISQRRAALYGLDTVNITHDWKRDAEREGIDPAQIRAMVIESLRSRLQLTDGGGVGGGEATGDASEVEIVDAQFADIAR